MNPLSTLLLRRRCPHERVRCVHGDEINWLNGKRSVCLDCGKALASLPRICSTSMRPHGATSWVWDEPSLDAPPRLPPPPPREFPDTPPLWPRRPWSFGAVVTVFAGVFALACIVLGAYGLWAAP